MNDATTIMMNALDRTEAALQKPKASNFLTDHIRPRNLQFGVMIRSTFQKGGNVYAHLDDTTNLTKARALDEAMNFDTNDLLGLFSIDMATGEIAQIMNRADLIDYCDERRAAEQSDSERAEQHEIDRHNFMHGTTL